MDFVLDASIVACWILPDEQDPKADLTLSLLQREKAFVPEIWRYEVGNFLVVNERRGRLTIDMTADGLKFLSTLPIGIERSTDEAAMLTLARKYRLTVYDAAYLELARRKGLPLATLDAELIAAAKAERVALI